MARPSNPIATGTLFAAAAALAFGMTTPLIRMAGAGVGPLTTAALLYLGAALGSLSWRGRRREPSVPWSQAPRLLAIALLGAALAPTALAWGLQRISAVQASLLLNGEAVLTVLFAGLCYREPIGRRVLVAAGLMLVAATLAVSHEAEAASHDLGGALAVFIAVAAWALDNVLTRPLADFSPSAVVRLKALLGAAMTALLALVQAERLPTWPRVAVLLLCGMSGYGLSLRLYLLAQRRIGAARTGSVFAVAPFIGAALGLAFERRAPDAATLGAAALFAAAIYLHVSERHAHEHRHHAMSHEHAHCHDDGHHDHAHEDVVIGEHSHPHLHAEHCHAHQHGPDLHHAHGHEEHSRH